MGNVMQTNCHPFCFKNITFMHNGTIPHYKFIKRTMMHSLSDRAFGMIQGTTDSEMMFALFVTHFEHLSGETDGKEDEPYSSKDHTQTMTAALRETLHQVHKLALEYENNADQPESQTPAPIEADGADNIPPLSALPYTKTIGRLNLAVTNGKTAIAARYVCSDPSTAHSLYYTRGANIEYKERKCCVAKCNNICQPMVVVSSEPLGASYECEVVPPNHMVITGPNNYFSVEKCYQ